MNKINSQHTPSILKNQRVGTHIVVLAQYKKKLHKAILNLTQDIEVVEDIVQETFARTIHSTQASEVKAPFSYLLQVARTVIYEQWRYENKAEYEELFDVIDPTPDPELYNVQQQKVYAVEQVLQSMPPLRKHIFELRRLHGVSRTDIAKNLNMSEEAVKKHINRAMVDITKLNQSQYW